MALFLSGSLLIPTLTRGVVVFDSSGLVPDPIGVGAVNSSSYQAQSFVFSGGPSELGGVTLVMKTAPTAGGNFFVALYDNGAGNLPGTSLLPLSGEANPAVAGNYLYTHGSTLNLAAGNTYWVVAGVSSGTAEYDWSFGFPDAQHPLVGTEGVNGGANWNGTTWTPYGAGEPFAMIVEAVPEPGWAGALAIVVCGIGAGVRALSKKWRPYRESNPGYHRERVVS